MYYASKIGICVGLLAQRMFSIPYEVIHGTKKGRGMWDDFPYLGSTL